MLYKQKYLEIKEDNNELKVFLNIISKNSIGYSTSLKLGTPITILQNGKIYCIKDKLKKYICNSTDPIIMSQKWIKTNFNY